MHFYTSLNDDVLPQTSSEDWAGRVPENEKWRQMGIDACTKVLTKAMAGLSPRTVIVTCLHAIPTDWLQAVVELTKSNANGGHIWKGLAIDSPDDKLEQSTTYIMERVYGKWETGSWQIPGYDRASLDQVKDEEVIEKPKFDICIIRNGQLNVVDGAISTFAGHSLSMRARLGALVAAHDQEFGKAEHIIGAPSPQRPRTETLPLAIADAPAAPQAIDPKHLCKKEDVPMASAVVVWTISNNVTGVVVNDGHVYIVADEDILIGSVKDNGRILAHFGAGSWSWVDQMKLEMRAKGFLLMFHLS